MPNPVSVEQGRWLKRFARNDRASVRLLCFHYAGGNASIFRDWPALLPPFVDAVAVQLPGRADRFCEPPYDRMEPLVDKLLGVVEPLFDRPVAFYGVSMGARVAWALSHALADTSLPSPVALFVAASAAPSLDRTVPGWDGPDDALVAFMRKLGGTPPEVFHDQELLRALLPTLRADLTLLSIHADDPAAPLAMPIHAFAGRDDPDVPPDRMLPWRDATSGNFRLDVVPSGHFFESDARRQVTKIVAGELRRHA